MAEWPHKVTLQDNPNIVAHLKHLATSELGSRASMDDLINWMFQYVDSLGNDAFLELTGVPAEGWVVFHTDEEVVQFILAHQ